MLKIKIISISLLPMYNVDTNILQVNMNYNNIASYTEFITFIICYIFSIIIITIKVEISS